MSRLSFCTFLLLWGTLAEAREAEDDRLSERMATLARKGQWDGVERDYRALSEPTAADHLLGAEASRDRGDLDETAKRLELAVQAGDDDQAKAWLADLTSRSRPVDLTGKALVADPPPFAPDAIAALRFTNAELAEDGAFLGRLFTGSYELDGRPFQVEPGEDLLAVVAPPPSVAVTTPSPPPDPAGDALTPPPSTPKPPRDRSGPSTGKVVLLGAAGGMLLASAGLYATGAQSRSRWAGATDIRDVRALRMRTNRSTQLSGATLGVAVGLGTIGLVLP